MSITQEVVNFIDYLIENCKYPVEMSDNVKNYIEALKSSADINIKPIFTPNGKLIVQYLQTMPVAMYRAKDIAEGMNLPSKQVSGAMRKLCEDGYVEKIGQTPVVYILTSKGKEITFNEGD